MSAKIKDFFSQPLDSNDSFGDSLEDILSVQGKEESVQAVYFYEQYLEKKDSIGLGFEFDLLLRKTIGCKLSELEQKVSLEDFDYKEKEDYITNLIQLSLLLKVEMSVYNLVQLFCAQSLRGFWAKNSKLRIRVINFTRGYFKQHKETQAIKRIFKNIKNANKKIESYQSTKCLFE